MDDLPAYREKSLRTSYEAVRSEWRWVVAGGVLGVILSALFLVRVPAQFEGGEIVELRMLDGLDAIETPERAAERIKLPTFQADVIDALGWHDEERVALYKSSLRVTVGSHGWLYVRLRGFDPQDVGRALEATRAGLNAAYHEMARKPVTDVQSQLNNVSADIQETEALLKRLDLLKTAIPSTNHTATLKLLDMIISEKRQIRTLREQEAVLLRKLERLSNSGATSIGPPSVVNEVVFPKKGPALIIGLFAGMFIFFVATKGRRHSGP